MTPNPASNQQALYRRAFARNCLLVIVKAYQSLDAPSLHAAQEPAITGSLVEAANQFLEDADATEFEHLVVSDDPPQNNNPGRQGKARTRIDIEFVSAVRGRRPRFHLEAKRLYRSDSADKYFGAGGLGMFLKGAYASEWPSVAMLGYVQNKSGAAWLKMLGSGFASRIGVLDTCPEQPGWSAAEPLDDDGATEVFESCHRRNRAGLESIIIYHMVLE